MNQFEKDLFHKCFDKWGNESQYIMLLEECTELCHAITRILRNDGQTFKEKIESFTEELADVQIMMDEFIYEYNLIESVKYFRMIKCERLQKLLEKQE